FCRSDSGQWSWNRRLLGRRVDRGLRKAGPSMNRLLIALTLVCAIPGTANTLAAADTCDRACLKTALDQYLNAVVTHNPQAAPLFAGFRQTENAVVVKFGT